LPGELGTNKRGKRERTGKPNTLTKDPHRRNTLRGHDRGETPMSAGSGGKSIRYLWRKKRRKKKVSPSDRKAND